MEQKEWKYFLYIFLLTFIISLITVRFESRDPKALIQIAFEKQILCFFYALFGFFGTIIGHCIYNWFKNRKK